MSRIENKFRRATVNFRRAYLRRNSRRANYWLRASITYRLRAFFK